MELRQEAEDVVREEPALGGFIYATILSKDRLYEDGVPRLAQRLDHSDVDAGLIAETFTQALADRPELGLAFRADLAAVYDRDPACVRYIEPLLYFKGFHALVTHRFAHELLKQGRRDFALYLQSQSSRIFAVDINPAAKIGIGIMLDHGTGIVIGETAAIGDNCSLLQGVTLGGTGQENSRAVGRGLVLGMPVFLSALGAIGTAAMIWVGGSIIVHGLAEFGLHEPEEIIHSAAVAAGHALPAIAGFAEWLVTAAGSGIVGLIIGAALIPVIGQVIAPVWRMLRGVLRKA